MGEWSEYFEDFPEENPANCDKDGRFDPNCQLRKEQTQQELAQRRLDEVLKNRGLPKSDSNKK